MNCAFRIFIHNLAHFFFSVSDPKKSTYSSLELARFGQSRPCLLEQEKGREPTEPMTCTADPEGPLGGGKMIERYLSRRSSIARLLAAAALLLAVLSSCSKPTTAQDPSPNTPLTSSTPSTEAWESDFTSKQLSVYREAVQRVSAYESQAQAFFAAGKATSEAKSFFQDNLMTWQTRWSDLEAYAKQGIKIPRAPKVLSSKATKISLLADGAADVYIERCVDARNLGGTINGEPLPEAATEPVIQNVDIHKFPDGTWRVGAMETTEEPCAG